MILENEFYLYPVLLQALLQLFGVTKGIPARTGKSLPSSR